MIPLRRLSLRAAVSLLALGGALLVAEVALHVTGLAPEPGLFTVTASEYARVPGIFGPDQVVVEARGTRFEHEVRVNSLGYRGAEIELRKRPEEYRLLLVGDSFTWGHNVPDDGTLPAQLEVALRGSCGTSRVINAGLSGSTIAGQDSMLIRGLTLDPDAAVLVFHENDIDEIAGTPFWEQLAANRKRKSTFPLSVAYPLVRRSALWNLAQSARRRWLMGGARDLPGPTGATPAGLAVHDARARYAARLEAVRDSLAARGIPFRFVLYPHPESVRDGVGGRDYAWLLATAEGLGIPTLDLLRPLKASGIEVKELFLLPEDYHPSVRGHAVAAAEVARWLVQLDRRGPCAATSRTTATSRSTSDSQLKRP